MLLSGSCPGHFFQCTLQLKYTNVLSSHTLIIAALYGMALPSNLVRNFKNLQNRAITKSSYDTSRFLLNSLGWDNLSVRRAKQKANLMHKCIYNLAPGYLCNLFVPRTPNYDFRNATKKLMLPNQELITWNVASVTEWRYSMEQSSWGNTYIKFLTFL